MRSGGRQRTASARSARCTPGRAPHGPACPQRGGPRLHGAGSAPSPPDLFALVRSYEPPFRSHFGRASELRAPYYRAIFHPPCRNSPPPLRSEEHTSELQSRENLVFRLLLENNNIQSY